MSLITNESVFDINFLSDINYNPSGKYAAFVVSNGSLEENKYKSNIYLLDTTSKAIKKLTSFDAERSITWLDDTHIIFPSFRNEKDKDLVNKGHPLTVYNIIDITGGEATRFFSVNMKCSGIKVLDHNTFLLVGNHDHNFPDVTSLSKEESDQAIKEWHERSKAHTIFDEIPFWSNGKGIINKKRNRLYLYKMNEDSLTAISDSFLNLTDYTYDKHSQKVVYSGNHYTDMMDLEDKLFTYDLTTHTNQEILLDQKYAISFTRVINNEMILFALPLSERTSYKNSRFYKLGFNQNTPTILMDGDFSIGSTSGSDCKYGGGTSLRISNQQLFYTSTRRYSSYIFSLKDKMEAQISRNKTGSIDCFDIHDDKIIFIGVRDQGLQEIYIHDLTTNEESQISNFNTEWLNTHKISYPEYFSFNNSENVNLDGFVIKPTKFDPTKKYPTILNIHGGPKVVYGDALFHEMQVWATEGYFVIFTNPRGSDARGNEFANIEGERYGTTDYNDIMEFVEECINRYPQIDESKLGVTGGSYGGLMTNWIVGHTNRFKAAATQRSIANYVSKCLTTDIGYYHNLLQMGGATPWSNEDVLWDHSPLKYADKCTTPLLFIHSDEDYRCYMGDALQMFTALKMHGVDSRFCLFHGENHELSRAGKPKNRMTRLKEITDWMNQYLK